MGVQVQENTLWYDDAVFVVARVSDRFKAGRCQLVDGRLTLDDGTCVLDSEVINVTHVEDRR